MDTLIGKNHTIALYVCFGSREESIDVFYFDNEGMVIKIFIFVAFELYLCYTKQQLLSEFGEENNAENYIWRSGTWGLSSPYVF